MPKAEPRETSYFPNRVYYIVDMLSRLITNRTRHISWHSTPPKKCSRHRVGNFRHLLYVYVLPGALLAASWALHTWGPDRGLHRSVGALSVRPSVRPSFAFGGVSLSWDAASRCWGLGLGLARPPRAWGRHCCILRIRLATDRSCYATTYLTRRPSRKTT